jgi:hypothetical protein
MADHGIEFEVAEAMLAHAPGSSTVAAYHRTSMLERGRPILQRWGDFLEGQTSGEVVPIHAAKRGKR